MVINETLVRRLSAYYPMDRGVGALEPDLLGETLVVHVLRERFTKRDYLERVLLKASSQQLQRALAILGRIATEYPDDARAWLRSVLSTDTHNRVRPAFFAALAVTEQHLDDVLGKALAEVLRGTNDIGLARDLAPWLPEDTVSLGGLKVWVSRQIAEHARSDEERAAWTLYLGAVLRHVGDRGGALSATDAAVGKLRELAVLHPQLLPELARGLQNLGALLSEVGDHDGALSATREALALRRSLAAPRPELFWATSQAASTTSVPFSTRREVTRMCCKSRKKRSLFAAPSQRRDPMPEPRLISPRAFITSA